ncbi:DUF1080 domain-containing protein [bacterium]|nr:MAG: DUF1080 domain-containing protein [bacterium]
MSEALARRWDLTVTDGDEIYPSWVDLSADLFVGRVGSARPIPQKTLDGDNVRWQLPKQYETREDDLVFEGALVGEKLVGTTISEKGETIAWVGVAAPAFGGESEVDFEPAVELVGENLDGWTLRSPEWIANWSITEDGLENSAMGSDLISDEKFGDFRLTAEYRYPAGSNSGIYLRGRYEFQVLDDHGQSPHVGGSGAIYGFVAPTSNAAKPAGEWNTAVITLIGRTITVDLNGERIVDAAEIPGITGGALDSDEGAPGPIFVQGDHGPVTYRRLSVERARLRSSS